MIKLIVILIGSLTAQICNSSDSKYCPKNHGFISVGMTTNAVLSACGQPTSTYTSDQQVTKKVPVKQLIFTDLGRGREYPGISESFYNQWSLPGGAHRISIEVDIINNKVSSIRINGSTSNATSLCGSSISNGDDINKVYNLCGSPSSINETYLNQAIPSNTKPEIWTYQIDKFQPTIRLTFVNGRLESID